MAQETAPARDALMTTELVPEQILPKVLTTFGLTAVYVFIICWITGSATSRPRCRAVSSSARRSPGR